MEKSEVTIGEKIKKLKIQYLLIAGSSNIPPSLIVGKSKCNTKASVTRQPFVLFYREVLHNNSVNYNFNWKL